MTVRYPGADRDAVSEVTLEIPAQRFTVVVGPSGCGKSTLLRTVNGLALAQSGSVYVGDERVDPQNAVQLRRRIGYVIQAVGLFSHMTVAQNIAVVPSLLQWERSRINRRVDELLELVGLDAERYRSRYPRELSGGEQQRVGVARAIAAQPQVLLMDEPFGAVDAIVRRTLQTEIQRVTRSLQATILFVTHDVDEALLLADHLVVMREGRIEQHGTPDEVLAAPSPYTSQLFAIDPRMRRYDERRPTLQP